MALNSLYCADVPLSNYSLTHSVISQQYHPLPVIGHYTHWPSSGTDSLTQLRFDHSQMALAVTSAFTLCSVGVVRH